MLGVILRLVKGSELTYQEQDDNTLMSARVISEWGPDIEYQINQLTSEAGAIYKSLTINQNKLPSANVSDWAIYVPVHTHVFADIVAATIDEDNMATNSNVRVPTQQSVKAYVDASVGSISYTDEQARDAIGTALTNTANIEWNVNDVGNTISANVILGSISFNELDVVAVPTNNQVLSYTTSGGGSLSWITAPNPFVQAVENSGGSPVAPTVASDKSFAIGSGSTIGASCTDSYVVGSGAGISAGSGSSQYSSIFGGRDNDIVGSTYSTVIGGWGNAIGQSNVNSSIIGGLDNVTAASTSFASLFNSEDGQANANHSSVINGVRSTATAEHSVVFGVDATTTIVGEHAKSSGTFTSAALGSSQTSEFHSVRAQTTDATTATMLPATGQQLTVPSGATWAFRAIVAGRQTGGVAGTAGDSAGFIVEGAAKNVSGSTSLLGTANITSYSDAAASTWAVALAVSGANLQFRCTGEADKNIDWSCTVTVSQVK